MMSLGRAAHGNGALPEIKMVVINQSADASQETYRIHDLSHSSHFSIN
jgi:hypothetical protein